MSGADERDQELEVSEECVAWCRAQDYGVMVGDDMAPVDLDWWNRRLQRHAIPTRIVGRDADGAPTDHGVGYLRRADLTADLYTDPVTGCGSPDLGVLYRAAAWHTWATQTDVNAELIEMWLSSRWRERTAHHTAPMTEAN